MRSRMFKLMCWIMSALLCMQLVPTNALAYPEPQSVEDSNSFTMAKSGGKQAVDSFAFHEDCFMRSSFYGCTHLAELSAQMSLASVSWFGQNGDPYEDDLQDSGRNIKAMLTSMGFSDVQANGYYSSDTLPNSVGVAAGHRAITVGNKDYTLLAVAIRSSGYQREWMGNFTIGSEGMVQGFQEARDEALRFIKQYVNNNGISNDLKIWTAGHSRGGAVANMVSGFLAGGGARYLNDRVTIDPQNVYCYSFATPTVIKPGLSKAAELSVMGARGGTYALDTPGDAYDSTATGTLDPTDASIYGGIRNYLNEYDIVPLLPPTSWGFTRYGANYPLDGNVVSSSNMAAEFANINDDLYQKYLDGANPADFMEVQPDVLGINLSDPSLDDLAFVPTGTKGDEYYRQFIERLVAGLAKDEPTNADYVSRGYEETLCSVVGLLELVNGRVLDGGIASVLKGNASSDLVKSVLYGYLAYASKQLMTEGRAKTEKEACAIVAADLLSYVYGSKLTIKTDDDFLKAVGKIVSKHENTPLIQSLLNKITAAVPEDKANLLMLLLSAYKPKGGVQTQSEDELVLTVDELDSDDELTDDELNQLAQIVAQTIVNLRNQSAATTNDALDVVVTTQANDQELKQTLTNFLKALGSDSSSSARNTVYAIFPFISGSIDIDFGTIKAATPFADTLNSVLKSLLKKGDNSSYASLDEASNDLLAAGIQAATPSIVEGAKSAYGDAYANEVAGYLNTLTTHQAQLKTLVFNTLFGAANYNFTYTVTTLATLLNNPTVLLTTHVNEQYLAWVRAVRKAVGEGTHTIYHSIAVTAEPASAGTASADVVEAAANANITLQAKPATGYSLAGWTVVAPEGLVVNNNSFAMPDANVEVRAQFATNTYAVTFKANGGKGTMAKQSFTYGTQGTLTANAFTRSGYSFTGWNTKADGSGTSYKNKQTVKNLSQKNGATITLYAQWKKNAITVPSTQVTARMQGSSWLKTVKSGAVAGKTTGKKRLDAFKVKLAKSSVTGGIEYRSHFYGKSWQSSWKRDGKASGATKTSQHLDAIQIRLYGKMKSTFDVYYRTYVQGYGWMGWAKNGQKAGTTGTDRRVGAVQVVLVKKDAKAPAKTFKSATRSYTKAFVAK